MLITLCDQELVSSEDFTGMILSPVSFITNVGDIPFSVSAIFELVSKLD